MTTTTTNRAARSADDFVGVPAMAGELDVARQTIRDLIHSGALPAIRIGRALRVRRSDFDAFIAAAALPI